MTIHQKNFIEFGLLPFVGRETILKRILNFFATTLQSQSLQIALIQGEAGVGKTSFIKHITPILEESGYTIVHIKLFPEGVTSIIELMALALNNKKIVDVIKIPPNGNLIELISTIRRLCQLKQLVVIIEDIHLLNEESQKELLNFQEALKDETLPIILLSRPIDIEIRRIFELRLIDDITFENLNELEVGEIFFKILNNEINTSKLKIILDETLGNALAIHSLMVTLNRTGGISFQGNLGVIECEDLLLKDYCIRITNSVIIGFIINLDKQLLENAKTISQLGEVFAIESVREIIDNPEEVLDELKKLGLIINSTRRSKPIPGFKRSEFVPLTFTHSLLHDHLLKSSNIEPSNLLDIFSNDFPIYSYVPLNSLAIKDFNIEIEYEKLINCFNKFFNLFSYQLNDGYWKYNSFIIIIEKLFQLLKIHLTKIEIDRLFVKVKIIQFYHRKDLYTLECQKEVVELIDFTYLYDDLEMIELRFTLFVIKYISMNATYSYIDINQELKIIFSVVSKYPEIRLKDSYVKVIEELFLIFTRSYQSNTNSIDLLLDEYEYFNQNISKINNLKLLDNINNIVLLINLNTKEEIQEKLLCLKNLNVPNENKDLNFTVARFLYTILKVHSSLIKFDNCIDNLNLLGKVTQSYTIKLFKNQSLSLLGESWDNIIKLMDEAFKYDVALEASIWGFLTNVLFLRNEKNMLSLFKERYRVDFKRITAQTRLRFCLLDNSLSEVVNYIEENKLHENPEMVALAKCIIGQNKIDNVVKEYIYSNFKKPVITIPIICDKLYILRCLQFWIEREPEIINEFGIVVQGLARQVADLFYEKNFYTQLECLIIEFKQLYQKRKLVEYRKLIKESKEAKLKEEQSKKAIESKLRITLIGNISIVKPDSDVNKIRGERMKHAFAVIAINEILNSKLKLDDFNKIITEEKDPIVAKTMMRSIRFRLNEQINEDYLIINEGEPIMFNMTNVHIDIVEIHKLLKETKKAIKENDISVAIKSLASALEMIGDKVFFPGLYSEFFETMREDLETSIRNTTISLVNILVIQNDFENSEKLLKLSLVSIPYDDELTNKLEESLIKQDRKTESSLL